MGPQPSANIVRTHAEFNRVCENRRRRVLSRAAPSSPFRRRDRDRGTSRARRKILCFVHLPQHLDNSRIESPIQTVPDHASPRLMTSDADPSTIRTVPRPRWMSVSGAALLCALATCGRPAAGDETGGMAAALEASPGIAPRLSVSTPFRRCVDRVPRDGTIPRAECSAPRRSRRSPLALANVPAGADDARSVHRLALLDLTANDPRGIALDRAITSLRRVVELSDDPTPALIDLSAALIVRAERTQAPRDLLEAYETAQKATDRQPHNPAALYNRALALDRFGLVEETAEDWKAALAADSTSSWAGEAQRRLRALQSIHAPIPPRDDAPLADYARYAAEEPQGARELGMDKLLAEWGDAALRGDRTRADERLRRAEALGIALLRRPGGDASLADMVRAVRGVAADSAATRKLAEAHREYGAGAALYEQGNYASAQEQFARATAASGVLQRWSTVFLGVTLIYNRSREEGVRLLGEAIGANDAQRYPALSARARWASGNTLAQEERYEPALAELKRSSEEFGVAGENENEAAALGAGATTASVLGQSDDAYQSVRRALGRLTNHRTSVRLHNVLASTAEQASRDGLLSAAIAVQSEGVVVAARKQARYEVEARLRRSRLFTAHGDDALASGDLAASRALLPHVTNPDAHDWLQAELHQAEALATLRTDPARSVLSFDSAAGFFSGIRLPIRLLPILIASAAARLRTGDQHGATQRLEAAVNLLEERRDSIRIEPRRAAVFDAARSVVDRLVILKLSQGDTVGALRYIDRARASLAPAGRSETGTAVFSPRSHAGEVMIEYAMIGDTILIWTVNGRLVRLTRMPVDTIRLARTIETVISKMERRATEAEVRPSLVYLYDVLIRPVADQFQREGNRLAFIVDGMLAEVPFAALYDSIGHQFVVEKHAIRYTINLQAAAPLKPSRTLKRALFVSDPAFDPGRHPLLDRLPHARDEVRRVTAMYPASTVIEGREATVDALMGAFSHADIIHFGGHAVFDDVRPELSYLVLASVGSKQPDVLTAATLSRLDLNGTRLVVLAACRTVRSGDTRAGGYSGLSGALLAAGAWGTVGSTWEVDDLDTGTLIPAFYDTYLSTADAPGALQRAQLQLLRSNDAELHSPAAWAGFRYTGS